MTTSFLRMSIRFCSGDPVELQWTGRNVLVGGSKTLHRIHLATRMRNRPPRRSWSTPPSMSSRVFPRTPWLNLLSALSSGSSHRFSVSLAAILNPSTRTDLRNRHQIGGQPLIGNQPAQLPCSLLAQSGHVDRRIQCPLLGDERTHAGPASHASPRRAKSLPQ